MSKILAKKQLAEQLKTKINSPDYVAVPDLITHDDRYGKMTLWLWGVKDGNIHKKENWISGDNINLGKENKYKSEHIVSYEELEKEDWEEIVALIERRNKEKEQIYDQKKDNIKVKLNNRSNLYYYWGRPRREHRADVWIEDKEMQGYVSLWGGRGNGLTYYLYIAKNHPILDNFSFKTGFYLVETDRPIEKSNGRYNGYSSTGGENNPYNFAKFVETNDRITITPYSDNFEPRTNENKRKIVGICNKCSANYKNSEVWYYWSNQDGKNSWEKLEWFCGKCWQKEEQNYRQQSSKKNPVYKIERHKSNLGDEHHYYFENGRWISLESEKPDPTITKTNNLNQNNALLISIGIGGGLILIIGTMVGWITRKKSSKNK